MKNTRRSTIISYLFATALLLTSCFRLVKPETREGTWITTSGPLVEHTEKGYFACYPDQLTVKLDEIILVPSSEDLGQADGGQYFLIHKNTLNINELGDCHKHSKEYLINVLTVLLDSEKATDPALSKKEK